MNKFWMILVLSIFLLACNQLSTLAIAGTPTATNIPQGTISGKVIDSNDGTFAPTANVSTEPPTSSVTTDKDGNFPISNVPVGNYLAKVSVFYDGESKRFEKQFSVGEQFLTIESILVNNFQLGQIAKLQ